MKLGHPEYTEFEVVGFDSTPKIECGRSLPLLRNLTTNSFSMGTNQLHNPSHELAISEEEIKSWLAEGRITMLPKPLPAFQHAIIVYAREDMLRLGNGLTLPKRIGNHRLQWQRLLEHDPRTWTTLVPESLSITLLDLWGLHFRDLTTMLLERFLLEQDEAFRAQAETTAEIARGAAMNVRLRCEIFVRHGLAILHSNTPERIETVFNIIVRREYPQWNHDDYLSLVRELGELLRARRQLHSLPKSPAATLSTTKPDPWLIMLRKAEEISAENPATQATRSEESAKWNRSAYPVTEAQSKRLTARILGSTEVILNPEDFQIVVGEPACYYPGVLKRCMDAIYLDATAFVNAAKLFKDILTSDPSTHSTVTYSIAKDMDQPPEQPYKITKV